MDYHALARQILTRFYGDKPRLSFPDVVAMAAALAAENVVVRNTEGVPVTVYVAVRKYDDGERCVVVSSVDSRFDDAFAVYEAFIVGDTHRCKATIYVPPVVIPEVEGEVSE